MTEDFVELDYVEVTISKAKQDEIAERIRAANKPYIFDQEEEITYKIAELGKNLAREHWHKKTGKIPTLGWPIKAVTVIGDLILQYRVTGTFHRRAA